MSIKLAVALLVGKWMASEVRDSVALLLYVADRIRYQYKYKIIDQ